MLQALGGDLRFAFRMLRKSPVFTVVAVLVISLGSGAVTTIFSAMNAIVLRSLPGTTDGASLIAIQRRTPDGSEGVSASFNFYARIRDRSRSLEGVAVWSKVFLSIAAGGEGNAVYGNIVSGNYFSVLGVRPELGRFFVPAEDQTPLTHPVVVVSHGFWTTRLGADSGAIGRVLRVNGHPYTLIGVTPPHFRGVFTPLETNAWVPMMMQQQLRPLDNLSDAPWLWMFGRMRPGVTRAEARHELTGLTAAYAADASEPNRFRRYTSPEVIGLNGLPGDARDAAFGFLALLLGAAGLVLLIASVNVASMLSARALTRRREMALRTALGAGRARLIRQLLTETLLLFALGAAGGAVIAVFATGALERIPIPAEVPTSLELAPDPRVFGVAVLISLITGVIFGLGPALTAAGKDITTRLRSDSAGGGRKRSFGGNLLITGQLALSLLLLVAAGLFLRALDRGARVKPGFEQLGVATAPLNTLSWGYDSTRGRAFYRELRERVQAIPGVAGASFSERLPLTMVTSADFIQVGGDTVRVELGNVDADYFAVLRIAMAGGRGILATDDERAPRVAVVNETMARKYWPDGSGLGRTFDFRGQRVVIVGIARDSKYGSLNEVTPPYVYLPLAQVWVPAQFLIVQASVAPAELTGAIQRAVLAIDPELPRPAVTSLLTANSIALWPQRVAAIVTGALGLTGLLLATVGLYGIISYSVSRRTREIGIRVALGARRTDVQGMVVGEGMRLAIVGVVIGLVLAAGATRLLASLLFDVSALDPLTFGAMSLLFVGVALLASWLPARRAAGADPMAALRAE